MAAFNTSPPAGLTETLHVSLHHSIDFSIPSKIDTASP